MVGYPAGGDGGQRCFLKTKKNLSTECGVQTGRFQNDVAPVHAKKNGDLGLGAKMLV